MGHLVQTLRAMALWATVPFPRNSAIPMGEESECLDFSEKLFDKALFCFRYYLEITGEANLTGRWTSWVTAGTDVLALLGVGAKGSCIHLNGSGNVSCGQGTEKGCQFGKRDRHRASGNSSVKLSIGLRSNTF